MRPVVCAGCHAEMKPYHDSTQWLVYGEPTESDIAEGWPFGVDMGSCPTCTEEAMKSNVRF